MSLTGEQIRAGRAMLRMEQTTLAAKANISVDTVKRLEGFDGPLEHRAQLGTLMSIRRVFELAGLDLADGVRWVPKRHAVMINAIIAEVENFVRAALERQVRHDPAFLDRGALHVVSKLNLELLERVLRHVIPEASPDGQRDEDALPRRRK